jgi:RNA polymerase sigma factor (sigma-70 family)
MTLRPFEEIVTMHGPTVLRVCRAVVGPDDAEDAWADTFLAALRAYPRLRPDSNVEAWLVTIAHRKALDHARARSRRAVTLPDLPEPAASSLAGAAGTVGSAGGANSARDQLPDRLDHDDELWDALRSLPLKQRQTVVYHHVAGLPYRQVAGIVGGSEAAARRAAADGIAALRRALAQGAHR